jgi:hypothetical protein
MMGTPKVKDTMDEDPRGQQPHPTAAPDRLPRPVWELASPADHPSAHPVPERLAPGWRVLSALGAVAAAAGVVVLWFVGWVTFTGCFIKCDLTSADRPGGILLFTLAAACFVAMAVAVKLAATGRTAGSARVAVVAAVVGALAVALAVVDELATTPHPPIDDVVVDPPASEA